MVLRGEDETRESALRWRYEFSFVVGDWVSSFGTCAVKSL